MPKPWINTPLPELTWAAYAPLASGTAQLWYDALMARQGLRDYYPPNSEGVRSLQHFVPRLEASRQSLDQQRLAALLADPLASDLPSTTPCIRQPGYLQLLTPGQGFAAIQTSSWQELQTYQDNPFWLLEKTATPPHPTAFAQIDLTAPDELILPYFRQWLHRVRHLAEVTPTPLNLTAWHHQRLLPVLDLSCYVHVHGLALSEAAQANLVFADQAPETRLIAWQEAQTHALTLLEPNTLRRLAELIWVTSPAFDVNLMPY